MNHLKTRKEFDRIRENMSGMSRGDIDEWNKKAKEGDVEDEQNPAFILSMTATELVSKIAKGEINVQELAKRELENRGLDIDGVWVGFDDEIK